LYYSSVLGLRGAILSAVLSSLVIFDHVHDLHPAILAGEITAIAGITLFGIAVANLANHETVAERAAREVSTRRLAELATEPGYWDQISTTRTGLYVNTIEAEFLKEALTRRPPGVSADVGAGSGRLHPTIVPLSRAVIATEINKDGLGAMSPAPKVAPLLVGASQTSLPLRSHTIDSIICLEVPAVSEEAWFRSECSRILAPQGVVIVSVYNSISYKGLIARLLRRVRSSRGISWSSLYYRHTVSWHLRAWADAGYRVRSSRGFYWLPFPRGSNSAGVRVAAVLERMLGLRWLVGWSPWVLLELECVRLAQT
jgi:2-polyprenyl-3-methyl-5-hydroxy-6-metoxy-1,4-benzoquinol methylase